MKKIMNYMKSFVIAAMVLTSVNVWGNEVIFKENENVYSKTQDGVVFDLVDFAHYSNYYYTSGGNKKVGYLRWIATTDNVEVSIKKISIIGRSQTNGKKSYVFSSVSSTSKTQIFSSNSFNSTPLEYGISNSNIFGSSGLGDDMAIFFEGESEVHIKQLSVEYEIVPKTQTGAWTNELPNGGGSFYLLNKKYRKFLGANNKVAQNYNKAVKFTVGGLSSTTISYVDDATGNRVYVHEGSGSGKWQTSVPDSKYAWNIVSSNGGCYIYHRDPDYGISNRPRYIVMEDEYYNSYYATYNMSYPKDLDTKKLTDNDLWLFISEKQYNSIFPYYFKATATGTASAITAGCTAQVSFDNSEWGVEKITDLSDQDAPNTTTISLEKKVYLRHSEVSGWVFDHWEMNGIRIEPDADASVKISATSHDSSNPTITTFTAVFSDNKTPTFSCNANRVVVDGEYDMFSFDNTTTAVPSASNAAKFYYSLTNSANPIIAFNGEGKVVANRIGTETITFVQQSDSENHIKYGTTSFDIEVIRHSDGTLDITNVVVDKNTWNLDINLADNITTTSDGAIVVGASSDADVCTYADGKFHVGTKTGTATFEISVPQTDKYEAITIETFTVKVDAPFYAYAKSIIDAAKTNIPTYNNSAYLTALEATHNQTDAESVLGNLRGNVRTYLNDNNPSNTNVSFLMNNGEFDYENWNYGWNNGAFWNDQQNGNVHAAHTVGGNAGSTTLAETMLTQNVVLPAGSYTLSAKILVCQIGNSNLFVKEVGTPQNIAQKDLSSTKEYTDLAGEGSSVTVDFVLQTETNVMMGVWHEKASGITWEGKALRADNFQLQYLGKINDPLTWDAFTLTAGENKTMVASTAYSRAITFTSSDETIVSIADDGKTLIPHKAGNVTITASADNTGVYSTPTIEREINVNYATDAFIWITPEVSYEVESTIPNLATAQSGLTITYTSSNESVIQIVDGAITAVGQGTANLYAHTAGNHIYAPIEDYKSIAVHPHEQYIEWDQSFNGIVKNGDTFTEQDIVLVATAKDNDNNATGVAVNFSLPTDNGVATLINGNILHLIDAGTVTMTARTAESSLYETTETTLDLIVRNYGEACQSYLIDKPEESDKIESESARYTIEWENPNGDLVDADRPFSFRFKVTGGATRAFNVWYKTTTAGWTQLGSNINTKTSWRLINDRYLPANTTGVQFRFEKTGLGSANVKDVLVPMKSHFEVTDEASSFKVTGQAYEDLTTNVVYVRYADVPLINYEIQSENAELLSALHVSLVDNEELANRCGEYGVQGFIVTGNIHEVGAYEANLHLSTSAGNTLNIPIYFTITPADREIIWDAPLSNNAMATQSIEMSAKAFVTGTDIPAGEISYTASPASAVKIEGATITFLRKESESVEITAHTIDNPNFNEATTITKVWVIAKAGLRLEAQEGFVTNKVVTYGDDGSTITWDASKLIHVDAQNAKREVSGSIAFSKPATFDHAGEQVLTFVFTPTGDDYTIYDGDEFTYAITVQKKASEATATASTLTYGQKVSESKLTNSGTEGTWAWADAIANDVLTAGTHEGLSVHFTPKDQNMTELDATISLTINKATPTITWPTTNGVKFSDGLKLGDIALVNGSASVPGTFSWDEPTTALEVGTASYAVTFTPTDAANYHSATSTVSVTILPAKIIYDGTDWSQVPTAEDDVLITGDLVITDEVEVKSLTIEENTKVTIAVSGHLTVGDGSSSLQEHYGDLIINQGGHVSFNGTGTTEVRNLYIETAMGTKDDAAASSQLDGNTYLHINGNAYIDITLDHSGTIEYGYYDFTVPFPVNASNGVYWVNGESIEKLTFGRDYAILAFSESTFASGKYAWSRISGTLTPGTGYSITLDVPKNGPVVNNYNTLRFVCENASTLANYNEKSLLCSGVTASHGWNVVGNGTLSHRTISGVSIVQVYDHHENSYFPISANDYTFVVGSTFRVQATGAQSVLVLNEPSETKPLRAPSRSQSSENVQDVRIALSPAAQTTTCDQLFLSVTEDADLTYELGEDVSKFANPTEAKTAQLWCAAYGKQLCRAHMPLEDNTITYSTGIYAPQAGTYTLAVKDMPANVDVLLTHNGYPIWTLSDSQYDLSLSQGVNEEYGITITRRAPGVATGIGETLQSDEAQKIIYNNHLFILRNGMIFDAVGNSIR